MNIAGIIINKLGNCDFVVKKGKLIWSDKNIECPSDEDLKKWEIEIQAEFSAQAYARNRASAYDSVGDQLDQLMKDMRDGTTTHKDACEAVKAKFPKPE